MRTDRAHFVRERYRDSAYDDAPQPMDFPRATISAPHMHAAALEYLLPGVEAAVQDGRAPRFLDVGSGSGFLLAASWHLMAGVVERARSAGAAVAGEARALGVEVLPGLVDISLENLRRAGLEDVLGRGQIAVAEGDAWLGLADEEVFDVIHVGAAAVDVPEELKRAMRPGRAIMIIPVGPEGGPLELLKVTRQSEDDWDVELLFGVRYVPLVQTTRQ